MLNLSKNRQKLLRCHATSKPNFRVFESAFNGRIFQLNRSGTRNSAKTKQISVRVTSVQIINIGNTGYIRNIIRASFNNRNLQSRKETRSISKSNKVYITELRRISSKQVCLNTGTTKNTRRARTTRNNNGFMRILIDNRTRMLTTGCSSVEWPNTSTKEKKDDHQDFHYPCIGTG